MVADLTGRSRSALAGLKRELYFRNIDQPDRGQAVAPADLALRVDDGFVEGLMAMAYSLRRTDDFVQMEGHRENREEERGTWANTARFDTTTAPLLLERLTREATDAIEPARVRLVEMLELAIYTNVSPRAADYLARVSRMYIWGFDQELVPMARSVLESAMDDLIEAAGGISTAERSYGRRISTLEDKVNCCGPRHLALLSHEATRLSQELRLRANIVLHESALSSHRHRNSLGLVTSLSTILSEAFPETRDDLGLPLAQQ